MIVCAAGFVYYIVSQYFHRQWALHLLHGHPATLLFRLVYGWGVARPQAAGHLPSDVHRSFSSQICAAAVTPAINEGCTRSIRISHMLYGDWAATCDILTGLCTPYHPPNIAGVCIHVLPLRRQRRRRPWLAHTRTHHGYSVRLTHRAASMPSHATLALHHRSFCRR